MRSGPAYAELPACKYGLLSVAASCWAARSVRRDAGAHALVGPQNGKENSIGGLTTNQSLLLQKCIAMCADLFRDP